MPRTAHLAVPGAVIDGRCHTPNLPWELDEGELQTSTGIPRVILLNDFVGLALGVADLPASGLVTLKRGNIVKHGTKAIVGAGTGLGEAILVWDGAAYVPVASEAGHADFAPQGALQRALSEQLEAELGHVSVERVLSGPGLARIYGFLVGEGMPASTEVETTTGEQDPSEIISRLALSRLHPTCEQALDVFVRIYGAEAGNLALRCLPFGGLYLAGGIAPKITDALRAGGFLAAFLAKGRLQGLLESVPVHVVTDPDTPLRGAALFTGPR